MKYLESSFSVGPPAKQMEGTCEKCVWGTGVHQRDCECATIDITEYIVQHGDGSTTVAWQYRNETVEIQRHFESGTYDNIPL